MHAEETLRRLAGIPSVKLVERAPLSQYTRFGIGGPADLYLETPDEASFIEALRAVKAGGLPWAVIGGGTNLIVSDAGFRGVVLRFTGAAISQEGTAIEASGGAELQDLVDYSIAHGLQGVETMTRIPGSVGAAVYGNAGAYGHSLMERVEQVRFFDGSGIREISNAGCEFRYRDSIFKRHKDWTIFSARLRLSQAQTAELRAIADGIQRIRDEKYPPSMRCAGSIFKNLIFDEIPAAVRQTLPGAVIREGKVPSAYFLEQVGAKGLRNGDIHVASYHANLIYNAGSGTARELRELIGGLKARVAERFGFDLEEEVQYIGFEPNGFHLV